MAAVQPPPIDTNPFRRFAFDVRVERETKGEWPPGPTNFSLPRTHAFTQNALPVLLDAYERYGPVFSIRLLHAKGVFLLGPEANHYMTVSHADNFRWRDGSMGDLAPVLGDGLLTIDGGYHKRARRIMLPALHHARVAASAHVMQEEALRGLEGWRSGSSVPLYDWTRAVTLRVAMRALFGLDPDRATHGIDVAQAFEDTLAYYGRDYVLQTLRGPGTPWNGMHRARRRLDGVLFSEIQRRRDAGPSGDDILSLLLEAEDEDGSRFSDQEVRDQMMTLLFAGHDTATATVAFLFYELARNPDAREALEIELDGEDPDGDQLASGLPELAMAVDETLRLYPPAWVGPRRSVEPFELHGRRVPGGVYCDYCSWASHRLPDVWEEPNAFRPERFSEENRERIPKGAYVPFGGGSRTCIGMRFGLMEVKAIAATILRRFRLDLEPGYRLRTRQMPTLSPRGGLPMLIRGPR
jgi:retinoid hydroxylase